MSAPLPPHLVPGWVIDNVLDERPHSVLVAARGAESVTPPTQPRFAIIAIARPGHEEASGRELDSLVSAGVVAHADIIESTIVMWDGHGVAACVLRAGSAYAPVPASDLPLRLERESVQDCVDAPNARPSVRRAALVMVAVVTVAVTFATWTVLTPRSPPLGAVSWDPITATMSVERDGRVLTFQMGEPGDEVLLGDWEGDGDRSPALYRPSTGEVWLFTEWADADRPASPTISARTLAHGRAVLEAKNGRDVVTVYPIDAPVAP